MLDIQSYITQTGTTKSKEEVYKELLAQGRSVEEITRAYEQVVSSKQDPKQELHDVSQSRVLAAAVLCISIGVFSFVAANWDVYTNTLRLIILMALMVAVYAAAFLAERRSWPKASSALYFLGSIVYGASIFLIAQMYNIRLNWPDGFIFWMLGVLALAFARSARALWVLGAFLGIAAIFGYPSLWWSGINVVDRFFLTPWIVAAVGAAACTVVALRFKRSLPEDIKKRF